MRKYPLRITGKHGGEFLSNYRQARAIHVFLLRCEGLSYKECGERLGISYQAAMHLNRNASHLLMWAWRHILQSHTMRI